MKNEIINYNYDLYLKLSENGDFFAMKKLITLIFDDKMLKSNKSIKKIAFEYLKKLVENNDSEAISILGHFHYCGELGFIEQDYNKTMYYLNESLNINSIDRNFENSTLITLGYCYFYGRVNEPDYQKAFLLFGKAACSNDPNAMYKIGDMYREGLYVEKNIEAAFYWYQESYSYHLKDTYICGSISLRLGRAYLFGEGIKANALFALKYLQKAERKFYKLAVKKPITGNGIFAKELLKQVQELIIKTRKLLDETI